MKDRIEIIQGDITRSDADAIANAANTSLLGGGGVDGAIHRAAGPQLLAECRTLHGCETGKAKITRGYNLKAKYVLHTPGPVWSGGGRGEAEKLAGCYRSCLELAHSYALKSVAFCCISTGEFHFPNRPAAQIAVQTVQDYQREHPKGPEVIFNVFKDEDHAIYQELLG